MFQPKFIVADVTNRTGVAAVFFSVLEDREADDETYYPEIVRMAEEITLLDFDASS